jgi:hypothetical protein
MMSEAYQQEMFLFFMHEWVSAGFEKDDRTECLLRRTTIICLGKCVSNRWLSLVVAPFSSIVTHKVYSFKAS